MTQSAAAASHRNCTARAAVGPVCATAVAQPFASASASCYSDFDSAPTFGSAARRSTVAGSTSSGSSSGCSQYR